MDKLGINLGLLVSQIFNFTFLAVVLYFVAYKPVLRMLDARSERIKKGLEDAETASQRAAQMEQEFEHRLAEARREGQEIIAQAARMSEKTRQDILEKARMEANEQIEKAKEEIARERDLAMAELRQQVADLSLTISRKVIGATLDESRHRQLIGEFLEQAEELP